MIRRLHGLQETSQQGLFQRKGWGWGGCILISILLIGQHSPPSARAEELFGSPVQSNLMCRDVPNQEDQSQKFQPFRSNTINNLQSHGFSSCLSQETLSLACVRNR
ncbi:hypothetical protein XENORESO_013965 [Xenotaenia resolanae]